MFSSEQPELTNDSNEVVRDRHLWVKGQSANPEGRPKGPIRAKVANTFVMDVHRQWIKSGPKCLAHMAENDPTAFVKVVAGLVPKDVNINMGLQDQLAELLEGMNSQQPVIIEASDISDLAVEPKDDTGA